ncbi:hypothetical protein DTO021D3_4212 [Paecilomyces variotii]|nr:hypothetical protein DTO032I3_3235 [Paecilomyces variotii]KAJ9266338.1 hypothetical protein DTO212C5_6425 [Paecilomyces variotii]KAJ9278896.1 hypothetical protein DTO021D3_4212 [Paecilomyces variotii]KAJ9343284.1 hypothetical protein DTO027B6_4208 [Paecilomyces variotii]KAJ9384684.1 hypothetical protein DTO032I4_4506 [Paecilomyces variotii]
MFTKEHNLIDLDSSSPSIDQQRSILSAKMPIAPGRISGVANTFNGQWIVEGNTVLLHGVFSQSLDKWDSDALLEYENVEDLGGDFFIGPEESFSYVGPHDLSLFLRSLRGNKVKITGHLSGPISNRADVTGQVSVVLED